MIEAGTNPETTRKAPLAATGLPDFVLRQFKLGQPSHQQLYGILQAGIRDGSLAAGLRLPPTRVLARTLGIARNTVVHVYEQLTFEGYVQARVGRGTFVADVFPRPVVAAGKFPLDRNAPLSRRGERTVRRRWPRVCNGALSRPACRSCACSRYRPGTGCRRACGAASSRSG